MHQSCASLHGCMHKVGGALGGSIDQVGSADPLSRMWAHPLLWGGSLVGVEWVCVDLFTMACRFDEVWPSNPCDLIFHH